MDLQITCINKTDRWSAHERIKSVGGTSAGTRWKHSQPEVIRNIEGRVHTYYTMVNGQRANVIVATNNGNKYIKTTNDGEQPNNLLSLPECQ
jgi:hypothetical protein